MSDLPLAEIEQALAAALDELDAARAMDYAEFETDAVVTTSGMSGWRVDCTKHGTSYGGAPCHRCKAESDAHWKSQKAEHGWRVRLANDHVESAARAALASLRPTTEEGESHD